MNSKKIKKGVELILEGIGEDVKREGLIDTPDRIVRMYEEIFAGIKKDPAEHFKKVFKAEHNDMIIEKDITFYSMCEHHMLPFFGKVHLAYIPDKKIAGLSKLARTVEVLAAKLQIQENLTAEITDALEKYLEPKGVMVMIEAEHMCMTMRGVKKPGSKTITSVTRGEFINNLDLKETFFKMIDRD